jgi:hypothetical protein
VNQQQFATYPTELAGLLDIPNRIFILDPKDVTTALANGESFLLVVRGRCIRVHGNPVGIRTLGGRFHVLGRKSGVKILKRKTER